MSHTGNLGCTYAHTFQKWPWGAFIGAGAINRTNTVFKNNKIIKISLPLALQTSNCRWSMKQNDILTVVNLTILLSLAFEGKTEPTGKIFLDPTNVLKIKECYVISIMIFYPLHAYPK